VISRSQGEDVMKTISQLLASKADPCIPDSEIGEIPSKFHLKPESVFIDAGDGFHSDPFNAIYWAIQKRPKKLVIQLAGGGKIAHETVLSCYYLLQAAKQKGLKVKTVAWGSLIDGALLLFLCGDNRTVANPSAFFEISSLQRLQEIDWHSYDTQAQWEYKQQLKYIDLYREVFRLLNAFIPAEEVSDIRSGNVFPYYEIQYWVCR